MARRTKSDALVTRNKILDCAENLFVRQGVSRTTLQQIAMEAGVTRGAIYWHFQDKVAVLDAMLQRAKMPVEHAMQTLETADTDDPLGDLKDYAMVVFRLTESDASSRRVFEIVTLKIEYLDEMTALRDRRAELASRWMASAERNIRLAMRSGKARCNVHPHAAALGLWVLIDGLLRAWLMAPESFSLIKMGAEVVAAHLDSLRDESPVTVALYDGI
jgi:TetR/AcrR family acrAB operon transcriptional repressor